MKAKFIHSVSLAEVKKAFEDLINGEKSHEDIASWACLVCKNYDDLPSEFSFIPSSQEALIWDALLYLTGVDLQVAPKVYLHSREDFIEKLSKLHAIK